MTRCSPGFKFTFHAHKSKWRHKFKSMVQLTYYKPAMGVFSHPSLSKPPLIFVEKKGQP